MFEFDVSFLFCYKHKTWKEKNKLKTEGEEEMEEKEKEAIRATGLLRATFGVIESFYDRCSFSIACTQPCLSIGRGGSRRRRGMKLGTVVEHVTRDLCTKFEPIPVAGFCIMFV